MKWLSYVKLLHRAYRYKIRHDVGGIYFLLQNVKAGNTVFDVGAHKGGYLYWMQKLCGNNGKVVAFEPQLKLYDKLVDYKNSFDWKNVTIEHLALSNAAAQVQLHVPGKHESATSPGASIELHQNDKNVLVEQVQSDTLDHYCRQHQLHPHFLKIDVEGHELSVLQGAAWVIQHCRPKILIEIEARHVGEVRVLQTFDWFKQMNYEGFFLHHKEMRALDHFNFDTHQNLNDRENYCNNFAFTPA